MGSEESGGNILSSSADDFRFLPLLFWLSVLAFPPDISFVLCEPCAQKWAQKQVLIISGVSTRHPFIQRIDKSA